MPASERKAHALSVRAFAATDCQQLFVWVNDPAVRAVSFSHGTIGWPEHQAWFSRRLSDPNTRGYMVMSGSACVGQVRFDRSSEGRAVISVSIDASERGQGLGVRAIALGCAAVRALWPHVEIVAYVLPENRASLAAFAAAGFGPPEDCEVNGQPAKRQLLPLP